MSGSFDDLTAANNELAQANRKLATANSELARSMKEQGDYFRRMADHLETTSNVQEEWIAKFEGWYADNKKHTRRQLQLTLVWIATAAITATSAVWSNYNLRDEIHQVSAQELPAAEMTPPVVEKPRTDVTAQPDQGQGDAKRPE